MAMVKGSGVAKAFVLARRSTMRAGLVLAILICGRDALAARGRSGGPPVGVGHGRLLPLLEGKFLREFSTDRTQVTDSPFTLAPGKWEWSVEAASGSYAKLDTLSQTSTGAGRTGVRVGLPHRQDLSLVASGWTKGVIASSGALPDESRSGLGTFESQWKVTLSGVDSTGAGFGLLAFVNLPGSSVSPESQSPEAGVGVPFALALGDDASLGASTRVIWAADANDTGHHLDWLAAASVHRDLTDQLGAFVELVSVTSGEANRPWFGAVDAGLEWEPVPHLGLGVGGCAGRGAGRSDAGAFASVEIHG